MVVSRLRRLAAASNEPVDAASLTFFRAAFGALLVVASLRFFTHGWIEADYATPKHFLHYYGLGWVRPLPYPGMYIVHAAAAVAAAAIALGIAYRPACVIFAVLFGYAHAIDKSNYLNHYYLILLLTLLLAIVPLGREGRIGSARRLRPRAFRVRAWMLWLLRFQVGIVYFFGGVAKVGGDWLFEGEPLRIWLAANAGVPFLGTYLTDARVALAFSWAGLLFDLTIVPLLLLRRTRRAAYVAVLLFHILTYVLFRIGMFPWIMMVAATLFFDPAWPRRFRWLGLGRPKQDGSGVDGSGVDGSGVVGVPLGRTGALGVAAYVLLQLGLPLRHWAYPGNTLWTEEGFRFSWRIMLIEKSGELELTVVDRNGRRSLVDPRDYLTPFQSRMTATQPDMILELAHIVARTHAAQAAQAGGPVRVYADAMVSFNGRMRSRLIDPTVDLAAEEDGFAPKAWILPSPSDRPAF